MNRDQHFGDSPPRATDRPACLTAIGVRTTAGLARIMREASPWVIRNTLNGASWSTRAATATRARRSTGEESRAEVFEGVPKAYS